MNNNANKQSAYVWFGGEICGGTRYNVDVPKCCFTNSNVEVYRKHWK